MNYSKSFKKLVACFLIAMQVAYPVSAVAQQYLQLFPVADLQVTTGGSLPTTNHPPGNTSSTVTPAGRAALRVAPSLLDMGTVAAGGRTPAQTVRLSNLGSAPLTLGTLSVNDQFLVTDNCNGAVLPVLGTCQVNVAFAPTQVALSGTTGTVLVPFTAGGSQYASNISLSGIATTPASNLLPSATLEGFSGETPGLSITAQGEHRADFGFALQGRQSTSRTFIVRSNGTAPVSYNGLSVTPAGSSFSASSTCGATISVGEGCWVTATFAPGASALGTQNAELRVNTSSVLGASMPVSLTGLAQSESSFSLSAASVNVGAVAVNATGTSTLLVLNTGTTALTNPTISASGTDFSVSHNCPTALASGNSCAVTVTYAPLAPASVVGSILVDFQETAPQVLAAQGQGLGPILTVDATNQSFGTVVPGSSATVTYTLANEGNVGAPLSVTATPAGVAVATNCNATLAVGAACQLSYTYAPSVPGTISGTVTVSSTLNSLNLTFTGQAVGTSGFSVSTNSLAFGSVPLADTVSQSVQITNTGSLVLNSPTIAATGAAFAGSHNCATTLLPGDSCQAQVSFTPTAGQSYSGTLSVQYAGLSAQTVALSGMGQQATLAASPATLPFGTVNVGATSSLTSTITNSGNVATSLSYSGLTAGVTQSGTCSTTLGAGASCTVILTYAPTDTTPISGTVTVSGTNTSTAIAYTGTAVVVPDLYAADVVLHIPGTTATGIQDVSANMKVVNAVSGAAVQASGASKFGAGAIEFDGVNDHLTVANSTDLNFAAQDFTIEAWVYPRSFTSQFSRIWNPNGDVLAGAVMNLTEGGNLYVGLSTGGGNWQSQGLSSSPLALNAWSHVAVARQGGTVRMFVNGVPTLVTDALGTSSLRADWAGAWVVGAQSSGAPRPFDGRMNDIRITKGVARYTGAFTPAAAPAPIAAHPRVTLSSTAVAFGNVAANGFVEQSISVLNTGTVPLSTPTIGVTGSSTFVSSTNCIATLEVGSSCDVTVRFTPTAGQTYNGTLSVQYAGLSAQTAALSGTGQQATLAASPATLPFGNVNVGATSSLTSTITNSGNVATSLSYSGLTAGVTQSGTCSTTLGAGASCTVILTYAPTDTTTTSGTVTVSGTNTSTTIAYSGTGVLVTSFSMSASSVAFGNVAANGFVEQSISVLNTGNVPLSTPTIEVTGPSTFVSSTNCIATLGVGSSCDVTVRFTPTAGQTYNGTLSVQYAGLTAQTAALSGTGQLAALAAAPATLSFDTVNVGATSSLTSTITNSGNVATSLSYSGLTAGVTQSGTCSTTLGAGASCTVILTYAPTGATPISGTVTVSGTNTSTAIAYTGTAVVVPDLYAADVVLHIPGTTATGIQDVSANTKVVNAVSGAAVQAGGSSKFGEGALNFDGVNAHLAVANSTDFHFGAQDFTIETWAYPRSFKGAASRLWNPNGDTFDGASVNLSPAGNVTLALSTDGFGWQYQGAAPSLALNTWSHVAVTRAGGTVRVFVNGAPTTITTALGTTALFGYTGVRTIGGQAPSPFRTYDGLLNDFRVTKGVARYTGAFTPPTAPAPIPAHPRVTLSSTAVDFGGISLGNSVSQTVQVTNSGATTLTTPTIGVSGAASITQSNTCAATLEVGDSCTVTLTFAPTSMGTASSTLSVAYSGLTARTSSLSGIGQTVSLAVDNANQPFGNVAIGQTRSNTFTVTNNGNLPATLTIASVTAPFTRGGTCGATLAAATSCTVVLTYAPTTTDTSSASVLVSATSTSVTLTTSGTGVANPAFGLSSSTIAFGNVAANGFVEQSISVFNTGNVPISTPTIGVTGSSTFVSSTNCNTTIGVAGSCGVTVRFTPTAGQTYNGTLSVQYAGLSAQTVALSGTGQQATLAASPATLPFGNVNVGATSSLTSTITNSGNVATSLAYSGLTAGVTQSGTCSTTLGAGASCTVILTYTPSGIGSTSGTVLISGTGTSTSVAFSGTAAAVADPHAASVVLHIRGNTTTGTQDVSANPKAITALSGAAVQASGVSKFGAGAIEFDGINARLTVASSTDFHFGAQDFTIETWIYPRSFKTTASRLWNPNGDSFDGVSVGINSTGTVSLALSTNGAGWQYQGASPVLALNTWSHVAVTRAGGTVRVFVNGAPTTITTALGTTALFGSTTVRAIGGQTPSPFRSFDGRMNDFRITKGIARYTGTFTPPTAAFP